MRRTCVRTDNLWSAIDPRPRRSAACPTGLTILGRRACSRPLMWRLVVLGPISGFLRRVNSTLGVASRLLRRCADRAHAGTFVDNWPARAWRRWAMCRAGTGTRWTRSPMRHKGPRGRRAAICAAIQLAGQLRTAEIQSTALYRRDSDPCWIFAALAIPAGAARGGSGCQRIWQIHAAAAFVGGFYAPAWAVV